MNGAGAALRETVTITELERKAATITIEDLVLEHAKTVFRIAFSVVRNHADAEDIAQETFLRAMRYRRLTEVENHKAWLAKIAWRLAVDRRKPTPLEPLEDVIETLCSAEVPLDEAIHEQHRGELVRRLLDTLPSDLREAILLSTVQEMTSADVAQAMGIPEGSVRTRTMRARRMLRQKLAALLEKK
jgi:RNA polymerase sigma-70 factor (ECF subfamily)